MHPLAALPYRVIAAAAQAATRFVSSDADSKLARTFAERRDALQHFTDWAHGHRADGRGLLWMHAPSVGEGLMARPILEHAAQVAPELQLAYSWLSPSARTFGTALAVDVAGALPFDTTDNAGAMLDALKPSALVYSRADVWPMLTEAAARRGVPLALVSAALGRGSSRGLWSRLVLADAYSALDAVGAVDPSDAERLVALGVRADRITVTGDTRYDQVLARAAAADRASELLAPLEAGSAERPWLVAGSTWPADEAPLLRAWGRFARAGTGARLLIAPHEPSEAHCAPIIAWARGAGLVLECLGAPRASRADVVLVDRVGVLGDLYALARVAYVGGGFHDAGLHSVVEPASFGVPVIVGTQHTRSRDAMRLLALGGAAAVADAAALEGRLGEWFGDAAACAAAGAAARVVVESGRGATEKSWALLAPLLGRQHP